MIGTTEHYPAALPDTSGHSGVSWAAIFAGAATAAVLSLLLLMLGVAMGAILGITFAVLWLR